MAETIEVAANHLQSLKNALKQFKTHVTASNAATSIPRITKFRAQYLEYEKKFSEIVSSSSSSREIETLKKDFKLVHDDYTKTDRVFQNLKQKSAAGAAACTTPPSQSHLTHQQLQQAQASKYNTAGLETEEAYQKQRLQGIYDVEQSANELRGMFKDFNTMVHSQQGGLTTVEGNLDKATTHVTKGADEIRKARKL